MNKLPKPSWLTLPEVLEWLVDEGFSEDEVKLVLPRELYNGRIQARGINPRYFEYSGHHIIRNYAWEDAKVDWSQNIFSTPGGYVFTNIEVPHKAIKKWIGNDEKLHSPKFKTTEKPVLKKEATKVPQKKRGGGRKKAKYHLTLKRFLEHRGGEDGSGLDKYQTKKQIRKEAIIYMKKYEAPGIPKARSYLETVITETAKSLWPGQEKYWPWCR